MLDMDKTELDMWAQKHTDAQNKVRWAQEYAKDDPLMIMADCNIEFKKLLDSTKGEARLTKEFSKKVGTLADRERKAKKRAETFDIIKALDAVNAAKVELNQISTKYANIKFIYDRRK